MIKLRCLVYSLLSITLFALLPTTYAQKPEPLLVLDEQLNLRMPRNFRMAKEVYKLDNEKKLSLEGLEPLKISASAQFSWKTLAAAITHMQEPIWVVDLRQESHGFLNGRPISWYGDKNSENVGKSLKDIIIDERARLAVLNQYQVITVHQIVEKQNGVIKNTFPRKLNVVRLETEPMLLTRMELAHARIPVRDHFKPSDEMVDRFVTMLRKKPGNVWIHYHCRAGKGRATTFMVMHDIVENASKVSLEDIVKRQYLLGGSNLFAPPKETKADWAIEAAKEREAFIREFYEYAKDQNGFSKRNWTAWKYR